MWWTSLQLTMRFSDFLFTSTNTGIDFNSTARDFTGANPATNAFDGDTTTTAQRNGTNASIIFRPADALEDVTRIRVNYGGGNGSTIGGFNSGNEVAAAAAGWNEIYNGAAVDVNNIYIRNPGTLFISAIEITDANGARTLTNPFLWSAGVTLIADPPGVFDHAKENMFDGDTNTNCIGNTSGQTISWVPPTPITYNRSVEIWTPSAPGANTISLRFEGAETASVPCLEREWTTVDTGSGTFDNLRIFGPGTDARCSAVRIDGQIYVDGVNSSYGPNGFHLDFADPNDLGADRSGNENDWAATGFITNLPGLWSDNIAASAAGNYQADAANRTLEVLSPEQAFNGDLLNQAQANASAAWIYWTTNIECNTVTLIVNNDPDQTANTTRINGTEVDVPAATLIGSNFEQVFNVPDGTLTEFAFMNQGGPNTSIFGMRINGGPVLVDNRGEDYDVMQDSPTQNFATLNPIWARLNTLTHANLASGTSSTWNNVGGTISLPDTGQFYYELRATVISPETRVGFQRVDMNQNDGAAGNIQGYWFVGQEGSVQTNGDQTTGLPEWVAGDVIGILFDRPNNQVQAFRNGTLFHTWDISGFADTAFSPFVTSNGSDNTINFGQQPFLHQPDGSLALQTQNLSQIDVTDARDHFRAITGPGSGPDNPGANQLLGSFSPFLAPTAGPSMPNWEDGNSALAFDGNENTFAGTGNPGSWRFAPDADIEVTTQVEVRSLSTAGTVSWNGQTENLNGGWVTLTAAGTINSTNPITATTIGQGQSCFINAFRVDGNVLVDGNILAVAQQTFDAGLWWIKSRVADTNTQQHQLVDSINGNSCVRLPATTAPANYVDPSGNSVAWCWSTTEAWTGNGVNTNRRNPVAGFSHFNYTGDGNDTRDLDHGLGAPPEWVIIFQPNANDVNCYMRGLTGQGDETQNLILSTAEGAGNVFSAGIIYRPEDNDTFTVGLSQSPTNVNGVNQLGVVYRCFCWRPVPGYSAMGSYTGNTDQNSGETDGPCIYTGMRPAFIAVKCSTSTENWRFFDSSNNPNNPSIASLQQNTSEESNDNSLAIDILSNGFKLRNSNANLNVRNQTYCWAAFAESPFGATNSSPANAR